MPTNSKNVQRAKGASALVPTNLGVKHLTLRLPSAPDFKGEGDESAGLTRIRAMTELMTGERLTVHALLMSLIESAADHRIELPVPKAEPIPTGLSVERLDVRVTQAHIHMLDALRDRLRPHPDILDIREYYGRVDVMRELLRAAHTRLDKEFTRKMKVKYAKKSG
jgi:hypothetical protein